MYTLPEKDNRHPMTVEVRQDLLDKVKKEAKSRHITLRQIVESGLQAFLNSIEEKVKKLK